MDIPFVLKFLNKIELFQVVNKLDSQFETQIKELKKDTYRSMPLWQIEKKILFWTYKNHKHLGSPLNVDNLRSKKSYLLKSLDCDNTGYKEAKNFIVNLDPDKIELDFKYEIDRIMEKANKGDKDSVCKECEKNEIGNRIYEISLTAKEIEKANVRKVFGNLTSRGYAKYYPETQKEFSHWEKEDDMSRSVYEDTTTTQDNCDGILIVQEGMLMGELLNDLYYIKEISSRSNKIVEIYKEKTGANYFLEKNIFYWIYYKMFISIGYLALLILILAILKEFYLIINPVVIIFTGIFDVTCRYLLQSISNLQMIYK